MCHSAGWEIKKDPEKAAGLEPRLKGVKKKDVVIQLVHEAFWSGDDDAADDDETPNEWCGIKKAENMCWARGNWLSFMVLGATAFDMVRC